MSSLLVGCHLYLANANLTSRCGLEMRQTIVGAFSQPSQLTQSLNRAAKDVVCLLRLLAAWTRWPNFHREDLPLRPWLKLVYVRTRSQTPEWPTTNMELAMVVSAWSSRHRRTKRPWPLSSHQPYHRSARARVDDTARAPPAGLARRGENTNPNRHRKLIGPGMETRSECRS